MSVRCYPDQPEFAGPGGRAERQVWGVLRDQLPDQAALLHSVSLAEPDRECEADLVVAWPGVGVAVIEVKGGHVSRSGGQWYQSSDGDTHPMKKDPVRQAQDCKYMLRRLLDERRSKAASARFAHLVAFPFTPVGPSWSYSGCAREMVLAQGDLTHAADRVRAAVERHGVGKARLTGRDLESLLDVVEGPLPAQVSLLALAEENDVYVEQLTRDQAKVVGMLREHRRLKVIGGAGTGKTWLALEQARRLAIRGERVALVCYSRGLGRFLQRMTEQWPRKHRPAYVGLFHALPLQWGADPPPPEESGAAPIYYEERLPAQMSELAANLSEKEKFDSIVVDEAQDFSAAWWPPTLACLRDPDNGGLYAFLDEGQRVFERHGQVPIDPPPIVLDENIRNTRQIAQVFGSLGAEQVRYRGMKGPPARFVPSSAEEAIHAADSEVDRLLEEGWQPGQIALLVTGKRHPVHRETLDYHGWDGYWDAFFASEDVFYGHVLGFKGLERPVVILAVNGLRDQSRGREYLYVGLSRARSLLVVCGDLTQITALGGEGLRHRLAGVRTT